MRVGSVVYATDQGLGNLCRDFHKHGVIDEVMVFRHGSRFNHLEWYPNAPVLVTRPFNGTMVNTWLKTIDVMLFVETPFDWAFVDYCKSMGKKTVLIPMYEWTPKRPPAWFDQVINPSLLDQQYFPEGQFIPLPVPDEIPYYKRTKAMKFLVNGGNLGVNGGRGTPELLRSIRFLNKNIHLTIRTQDQSAMLQYLRTCPWVETMPNVKIEYGTRDYLTLWDGYDVLVAPERYNGLSLPLQEARAAGMFVLTTDRFPTNTWLNHPNQVFIPTNGSQRGSVGGSYNEIDIATVDSANIAKAMNSLYGRDISAYSESAVEWRKTMSWETLQPVYRAALEGTKPVQPLVGTKEEPK